MVISRTAAFGRGTAEQERPRKNQRVTPVHKHHASLPERDSQTVHRREAVGRHPGGRQAEDPQVRRLPIVLRERTLGAGSQAGDNPAEPGHQDN